MADTFTEVTSESWFGRVLGSLKGIVVGLLLIAGSVALLAWNENRAVTTAKALDEGRAAVVDAAADKVLPANDKKLVHVTGSTGMTQPATDPLFGVSFPAIRLNRTVEMYQWKEVADSKTHKELGGGTETKKTYSYEKTWAAQVIDSTKFKIAEGHQNPGKMLAQSQSMAAPLVTLGGFTLPSGIIHRMRGDEPAWLTEQELRKLPPALAKNARLDGGGYYYGADPAAPTIGDQRVTYKVLKPGVFSILAQQTGNTFQPYAAKAGRTIERVESGAVSAEGMFQHATSENTLLAWILRLVGFVLMAAGFGLVLSPISVFADVLPFVGDLVGAGAGFAALLFASAGSVITIAIAWIAVRPVLGGALLANAVAWFIFWAKVKRPQTGIARAC